MKHLEIELKNLKRVFALLDVGKDGVVTSEDIFVITGKLGSKLSLGEVSELIWEIDDSLEGRLTWANFSSAYYRCRRNASGFEPRGLLYLIEFLLMDKDLSGSVSVDEAMQVLYERHGKHSLERLTRDFFQASAGAAVSHHSVVTFDDFYRRFARPWPKAISQPDRRSSYSKAAQAKLHASGSWAPRKGLAQRSSAWARAAEGSAATQSVAARSAAVRHHQACRSSASAPSLGARPPSPQKSGPSLAWWDHEPDTPARMGPLSRTGPPRSPPRSPSGSPPGRGRRPPGLVTTLPTRCVARFLTVAAQRPSARRPTQRVTYPSIPPVQNTSFY